MTAARVLEQRRQVLVATVALQRFALRADIGSLRASIRPSASRGLAALAAVGIVARWALGRRTPVAGAVGALAWLQLALRAWKVLRRRAPPPSGRS